MANIFQNIINAIAGSNPAVGVNSISKLASNTSSGGGAGASGAGSSYNTTAYNTDFTNSDVYKSLQNAYSSASAGANPIDLSGIIADYRKNNQATIDTYNKTLQDTINTLKTSNEQSRNDLLTSLKRFQESNAENMKMQQQDFNASRATLEDETFMNQRNTIANAAARGLGGSGLQQLSQLQNRIAAGKNLNTIAQKNQTAQDSLRRALSQQQEDYDTKVSNLEANLQNAIIQAQNDTAAKINAANTNTTNLINNLVYNEQARQRSAAAQAASSKVALNNLLLDMKKGVSTLQGAEKSFNQELQNTVNAYLADKKKSDVSKLSDRQKSELSATLNSLYSTYVTKISGDLENYANIAASYGLDNSYTDTALANLAQIYNKYNLNPSANSGFR